MLGHVLQAEIVAQPWQPLKLAAHYGLMVLGDGAKNIFVATRPGLEAERAPDFAEYFGVDARLNLP